MSAMGVVNNVEGLVHALAMGVAANSHSQAQAYTGDSPRTIAAVRKLVVQLKSTQTALQTERAARAALEEENELLRYQLEETAAMVMRLRNRVAGN
jgi:cell division protein FtsB